MSKNIIICCDGTSNQYGEQNTNVVKLFSVLKRDLNTQEIYYDPGVGTFSAHPMLTAIGRRWMKLMGLAFGLGITQNIKDAYKFLMQNYLPGDQVYIFGFSRGAYTARAIAGLIHKCGLLYRDNENLVPYALNMYKHRKTGKVTEGFKSNFSQHCHIYFLGLWDTVSTVGFIWNQVNMNYTTNNESVMNVRHAISIDERRAFFRQNMFGKAKTDNVKQVWFAGDHCDIGGGYKEQESGLSNIALEWMLKEAEDLGLIINQNKAKQLLVNFKPDYHIKIHNSLKWYWMPAEICPKIIKNPKLHFKRQIYFNLGKRRTIHNDSLIHESVLLKIKECPEYSPTNLPEKYIQEPWIRY